MLCLICKQVKQKHSVLQIRLDKNVYAEQQQHDDCNVLALPSEKRNTKRTKDKHPVPTKLLSKKQRKHLEKIVEKKKKKANVCTLTLRCSHSHLIIILQIYTVPNLN
jgi:hypothetical protein